MQIPSRHRPARCVCCAALGLSPVGGSGAWQVLCTNPISMRAHPNRFILHNGEINTIKGNTDARENAKPGTCKDKLS